jgi:hypothetical protein
MSHDDLTDHAAAFVPMPDDPHRIIRLEWSEHVDAIRDGILNIIHGTEDMEPMYTCSTYTVTRNRDGSVEMLLGIRDCTSKPLSRVKILIGQVVD